MSNPTTAPNATAATSKGAGRRRSILPRRGRSRPRSAPPVTAAVAGGRLVLTPEGRAELQARAETLRDRTLPSLRPLLTESERDERHVAEFERVLGELDRIEQLLAEADTLRTDPATFDGRVDLGVWVTVELPDAQTETVRIVHPEEAFLDDERVSATSPMAIALLGARAGHTVWVAAPKGTWPCRVVEVQVTAPAVLV